MLVTVLHFRDLQPYCAHFPLSAKPTQTGDPETSFSVRWTNTLIKVGNPIIKTLLAITGYTVQNPIICVTFTIFFSLDMLFIGLKTNFILQVEYDTLWTPTPSRVLSHKEWVKNESDFPSRSHYIQLTVNSDGKNVLGREGLNTIFKATDAVRKIEGYDKVCEEAKANILYKNADNTCLISSVTKFWAHDFQTFKDDDLQSYDDVIEKL